jgi:hypothetical protein
MSIDYDETQENVLQAHSMCTVQQKVVHEAKGGKEIAEWGVE